MFHHYHYLHQQQQHKKILQIDIKKACKNKIPAMLCALFKQSSSDKLYIKSWFYMNIMQWLFSGEEFCLLHLSMAMEF